MENPTTNAAAPAVDATAVPEAKFEFVAGVDHQVSPPEVRIAHAPIEAAPVEEPITISVRRFLEDRGDRTHLRTLCARFNFTPETVRSVEELEAALNTTLTERI